MNEYFIIELSATRFLYTFKLTRIRFLFYSQIIIMFFSFSKLDKFLSSWSLSIYETRFYLFMETIKIQHNIKLISQNKSKLM